MTIKYKILLDYIKDLSVETPDAQSLITAREYISKYYKDNHYLNLNKWHFVFILTKNLILSDD